MDTDSTTRNKRFFDPPLSVQRHRAVGKIFIDYDVERFIDFGCGEGAGMGELLSHRAPEKWSSKPCAFTHAVGVDQDVTEVCNKSNTMGKGHGGNPYIPLHVSIWKADLTADISPLREYLKSQEVTACCCCEVIEHIPVEDLSSFSSNLLSLPVNLLVITTPNKTANAHMGMLPTEMRHADHKFEWTESEFKDWILSATESSPFSLHQLTGAGSIGGVFASSIAILTRDTPLARGISQVPVSPMDLIECRQPICDGECYNWWKWDVSSDSNKPTSILPCKEIALGTISHSWLAYDVIALIFCLCNYNNKKYPLNLIRTHPQIKTLLSHVPAKSFELSDPILDKFFSDVRDVAPGLELKDGMFHAALCLWCSDAETCRFCELSSIQRDHDFLPAVPDVIKRRKVVDP
eukprot:TRINITY_DN8808_c0_g2_i1.p1 TRINITY_DN8808_c0_g2~~TRINITY_DN8808_c0_g2_i1.p1  ORF type:complete len:406 (+),score=37.96 TRINITY_DN8808_c0_g2_i1:29-1246(+)